MVSQEFECVEPELQKKVTMRSVEELDSLTRRRWEQHLEICHACREMHRMNLSIAELIAEGAGVSWSERLGHARWRRAWQRVGSRRIWTGAAATAALGLFLALALPPSALPLFTRGIVPRGDEASFQIKRPNEGEVLYLRGGNLEWEEVADARGYKITIESPDQEYRWSGVVTSTAMKLPKESEVPGKYQAAVEPYPVGLVPEGQQDVFFRRDRVFPFLSYRLSHLPTVSAVLLALGALLTGLALVKRN